MLVRIWNIYRFIFPWWIVDFHYPSILWEKLKVWQKNIALNGQCIDMAISPWWPKSILHERWYFLSQFFTECLQIPGYIKHWNEFLKFRVSELPNTNPAEMIKYLHVHDKNSKQNTNPESEWSIHCYARPVWSLELEITYFLKSNSLALQIMKKNINQV